MQSDAIVVRVIDHARSRELAAVFHMAKARPDIRLSLGSFEPWKIETASCVVECHSHVDLDGSDSDKQPPKKKARVDLFYLR